MAKPVKVTGKLYFTQWMHQFNTKFNDDNNRFECFVGNISDEAQEKLKTELGIKPKVHKEDNIGNYFVGKSTRLFNIVDKEGKAVDVKTLGYGTEVIAIVESYVHKMSKMHGNGPSIKQLIVTKLVPYGENVEEDEFDPVL